MWERGAQVLIVSFTSLTSSIQSCLHSSAQTVLNSLPKFCRNVDRIINKAQDGELGEVLKWKYT